MRILAGQRKTQTITHTFPMHPFSTPWFIQGVEKGCIGNEWVNSFYVTGLAIYLLKETSRIKCVKMCIHIYIHTHTHTYMYIYLFWVHKRECTDQRKETSMMKLFSKIVNGFQPLTIFVKTSIADVSQGSKYAFVTSKCKFASTISSCGFALIY